MDNLGWKGLTFFSLCLGLKLIPMYKVLMMNLVTTQYVKLLRNCLSSKTEPCYVQTSKAFFTSMTLMVRLYLYHVGILIILEIQGVVSGD